MCNYTLSVFIHQPPKKKKIIHPKVKLSKEYPDLLYIGASLSFINAVQADFMILKDSLELKKKKNL
jgi:hypothetical protein